jgi:N-acetylneuraminate synthase
MDTLIIAEAGVNHNGDEALAFQLVDAAHGSGADVIKFQTFKAAQLVTATAAQAAYQQQNTGRIESQYDMLKRLELSHDAHRKLVDYCAHLGIRFLSTAFDRESLAFLTDELDLPLLKVPSGEVTNGPLMLAFARTQRRLIISTGMASLDEVEACLGVVAFGLTAPPDAQPSLAQFRAVGASAAGRAALADKVTLLHCTTEYPAPMADINLRAMQTLRDSFGLPVGYSDHSVGLEVSVAAVALGACVIEKHFTLDRTMAGPDHQASLEPDELGRLVVAVRNVGQALGDGVKRAQPSEVKNIDIARKSLVAACDIHAGQVITAEMLAIKRPGSGISPMRYWDLLGTKATRRFQIDELIE